MFDIREAFTYHSPTQRQQHRLENVRACYKNLAQMIINNTKESAEQTIALRALHEASMHTNYAIILTQDDE